ncbi:MAG: helix-turn-helix transcriptional regulator [Coriobacteriales bacterium]|nr:helix-turn-helix transcriptional regulator [Coriobacteriales bacterium]
MFWAWVFYVMFSNVLNPRSSSDVYGYMVLVITWFSACFLVLLASALFPKQARYVIGLAPTAIIAVIAAVCNAFPVLATFCDISLAYPNTVICWFVSGLGMGVLEMQMIEIVTRGYHQNKRSQVWIVLSMLLSVLVYLLVSNFDSGILRLASSLVLPIAAGVCLGTCYVSLLKADKREARALDDGSVDGASAEDGQATSARSSANASAQDLEDNIITASRTVNKKYWGDFKGLIPYLAGVFVFGIAYGICCSICMNFSATIDSFYAPSLALTGMAIVLIVYTFLFKDTHKRYYVFTQLASVVIIIALCFVSVVPLEQHVLCASVIVAAYLFYREIQWLSFSSDVFDKKLLGGGAVPTFLVVLTFAELIGWVLGLACIDQAGNPNTSLSDLFATLILCGIAIYLAAKRIYTYTQVQKELDQASVEDRWEEKVNEVAQEFKLSPRETEVFSLLARGRNSAFIEEQLVVSGHTVKTHMYNIYHKLDIHSQQELIDLVDTQAD